MIEVRDLIKAYGHIQALKSVSFSVADGEIVGLGPGPGRLPPVLHAACPARPRTRGTRRSAGLRRARAARPARPCPCGDGHHPGLHRPALWPHTGAAGAPAPRRAGFSSVSTKKSGFIAEAAVPVRR